MCFEVWVQQLHEMILERRLTNHLQPFLFLYYQLLFQLLLLSPILQLLLATLVTQRYFTQLIVFIPQLNFLLRLLLREYHIECVVFKEVTYAVGIPFQHMRLDLNMA